MKGIVFTEFLEMVEQHHGYATVDFLLENCDLPSGGSYTAVGTYDHREIVQLISLLSNKTETPIPSLLRSFGHHLFGIFNVTYPSFFKKATSSFDFLESIEHYIHVEVRKLYPDAELPTFHTKRINSNQLEMIYVSDRRMSALAYGLIEKAMEFYKEPCTIQEEHIDPSGQEVKFLITKDA